MAKETRTIVKESFSKNQEELEVAIMKILALDGFKPVEYKGEKCYKKGDGIWTAEEYIKTEFSSGEVTISGWILGYGKEMALSGFMGFIPKKDCKKVIEKIIKVVKA